MPKAKVINKVKINTIDFTQKLGLNLTDKRATGRVQAILTKEIDGVLSDQFFDLTLIFESTLEDSDTSYGKSDDDLGSIVFNFFKVESALLGHKESAKSVPIDYEIGAGDYGLIIPAIRRAIIAEIVRTKTKTVLPESVFKLLEITDTPEQVAFDFKGRALFSPLNYSVKFDLYNEQAKGHLPIVVTDHPSFIVEFKANYKHQCHKAHFIDGKLTRPATDKLTNINIYALTTDPSHTELLAVHNQEVENLVIKIIEDSYYVALTRND